jgi:hypothetical protein
MGEDVGMTESNEQQPQQTGSDDPQVIILGQGGGDAPGAAPAPAGEGEAGESGEDAQRDLTDLVEQPAKVMRIGSMIKQLLDEVKAAPLDDASRRRLSDIHRASIDELEDGLAPELIEELERLALPFNDQSVPTDAELRIAHAQLVGWLEGLFHGIQTTLFAQQMAARAQLEQMRRALPPGVTVVPGGHPMQQGQPGSGDDDRGSGMYL